MRLVRHCLVGLAALAACGGASDREVVGPRHVPASSGAPEVERVVDLGDLSAIPASGNISSEASDGKFVVGELILIEGDDFGKLPTIAIGGRPAKSLARTKGGGIVTRIPPEVAAGSIAVEVSHPDGRHTKSIEVQRYLAVADAAGVHLALAHADGTVTEAGGLPIAGTSDLCFGQDGRALYLGMAEGRSLKAISMAAKDGPRFASSYTLGKGEFVELACRTGVPTVVVLDSKKVTFFDSRVPTAISVSGSVKLPGDSVAAALSPDGTSVAVLSGKDNQLSLISIEAKKIVASISLIDNETVPLLRDLVFSPKGDEIWVLSGNSARSIVAGRRPTKIHRVAVHGISLSRAGSATVGKASGPRFLAVSQREAVMAAAAIRSTADRATLLLSTVAASQLSGADTQPNGEEERQSSLLRLDLEGKAATLAEGVNTISRALVSHDQKWAYAAANSPDGPGLLHVSLKGTGATFLRLGSKNSTNSPTPIPVGIAP